MGGAKNTLLLLLLFLLRRIAAKREVPKVSPLRAPFICGRIWRLFKLKNVSRKMPQISEDTYETNQYLEWSHQNRWLSRPDPPLAPRGGWVRPLNSEDIGLGGERVKAGWVRAGGTLVKTGHNFLTQPPPPFPREGCGLARRGRVDGIISRRSFDRIVGVFFSGRKREGLLTS